MHPKNNIKIKSKHCSITHKAFHDLGPCYSSRKSPFFIMPSCYQFLIPRFSTVPSAAKLLPQLSEAPSPNLHSPSPSRFTSSLPPQDAFSEPHPIQLPLFNHRTRPKHQLTYLLSNQTMCTLRFGVLSFILYSQHRQHCLAFSKYSRRVRRS